MKTFSISGTCNGQIDNAKLTVGFTYMRQKGGGVDTQTVAFNGEVKTRDDDFIWSISDTGHELKITASVTLRSEILAAKRHLTSRRDRGRWR